MNITKKCTTCEQEFPLDNFRKQSKNKDGLKYTCKNCDDQRAHKRYEEKKELIIAQVKAWQYRNRNRLLN